MLAAATAFAALARHARMVWPAQRHKSMKSASRRRRKKKKKRPGSPTAPRPPLIPSLRWVSDDYSIREKGGSYAIFLSNSGSSSHMYVPFSRGRPRRLSIRPSVAYARQLQHGVYGQM